MALNGKKLKAYLARRKMAKEGIETYDNGKKNGYITKAARRAKAASVSYVKRKGKEAYAEARESAAYRTETGRLRRKAYRESTRKATVSEARKRAAKVVRGTNGGWGMPSMAGLTETLVGPSPARKKSKKKAKAKPKGDSLSRMLGV